MFVSECERVSDTDKLRTLTVCPPVL